MGGEKSSSGGYEVCLCPLRGIIEVISRRWALQIIAEVGNSGRLRYSEILRRIRGISPRTLAYRLRELEAAGLMRREVFKEIPPRVEYSLTRDGEELRELIKPLMRWAAARNDKRC